MKIVFACSVLSYLRYFGPIIEYIKDEENIELWFAIRKNSQKYNGLQIEENYKSFLKILDVYFNSPEIISDIDKKNTKINCDILFTVCGVDSDRFDYKKHYAIQHCFDHLVHGKNSNSKTVHLCNAEIYGILLQTKYKTKYVIPPLPVAFSNLNTQIEFARKTISTDKKIVTIFFPRKGSIRLVRSIVKYLKKKDYFVVIKQRKKSQQVPNNIGSDLIVYDDIWYPSEAIFYPLVSDIAIGFGSAIFTDLCEVGINVIDNAIPKYTRKGGAYIRPNYKNYWYFNKKFHKNTINTIDQISLKSINNIKFVSEDLIKQFYLDLLKI